MRQRLQGGDEVALLNAGDDGRQDRFESVMELSANLQGILQRTTDHDEALAAFFEKRKPNFTGN